MLTLDLAMRFLEHAPPARPPIEGAPMGWTLADGATICNQCAGRIIDRGCQFNGTPIWDVPVECDAEAGSFALANDPPPHRPARFENGDKRRQRVCVEGMDLCAGQLDLF
jgi:hypothetical protein